MTRSQLITSALVRSIFLLGLLPSLFLLWVGEETLPSGPKWTLISGFLTLFIWGFAGLVIVLRKEYKMLSGCPAMIIGGVLMVLTWSMALLILIAIL